MSTAATEKKTAKVQLLRIFFSKDSYVIASAKVLEPQGVKEPITVKGVFHPASVGSNFQIEGTWVWNEKYRKHNFKVEKCEHLETTSEDGVVAYLVREGPNVGPVKAQEIYDTYGEQALSVLRDDPERIAREIKGFTPERAEKLSEWMKQDSKNANLKKWLYGLGITSYQIAKIFSFFGHEAQHRLKKECYRLTLVDGFGFKTVSKIGEKLGIADNDPFRIEAGVLEVMKQAANNGDTCVPHDILLREACKLLGASKACVIKQLKLMIEQGRICTQDSDPTLHSPFLRDQEFINDERQSGEAC